MNDIYFQIVNDPLASEEQKVEAQKRITAAKAKTEPQELTGPVTLPDGPIHTRQDKTTYQSKSLIISRDYAADLQRRYGTLHSGQATEEAAGQRLQAAVDPMTDEAGFLQKFPESEAFWDDVKAKLEKFYSEIDAESKTLKAKAKQESEQVRPPIADEPVTQPAEPEPMQPMSVVDRLLATKKLLGK